MSNDITTGIQKIEGQEMPSITTQVEKIKIKNFNEAVLKLRNGDIYTVLFVEPDKFFEFRKKIDEAKNFDLISVDGGFGTVLEGKTKERSFDKEQELMSVSFFAGEFHSIVWKGGLKEIVEK